MLLRHNVLSHHRSALYPVGRAFLTPIQIVPGISCLLIPILCLPCLCKRNNSNAKIAPKHSVSPAMRNIPIICREYPNECTTEVLVRVITSPPSIAAYMSLSLTSPVISPSSRFSRHFPNSDMASTAYKSLKGEHCLLIYPSSACEKASTAVSIVTLRGMLPVYAGSRQAILGKCPCYRNSFLSPGRCV